MEWCKVKTVSDDSHIMKKWDYKNNPEELKDLPRYAHKIVHLLCPLGHSYSIKLNVAKCHMDNQCPYCSKRLLLTGFNDFKTLAPKDQLKYWDYEANNKTPEETIYKRTSRVILKCPECGYSWESAASKRVAGRGCPICNGALYVKGFNDFSSLKPELLEEWDYELNNRENIFIDNLKNSKVKVWWKCKKCSKSWKTVINKRIGGTGCYYCAMNNRTSKGEKELCQYISTIYSGNIRENDRKILEGLEADIYLPEAKIIIEYNGDYWHSTASGHYKSEKDVYQYHKRKYEKAKENGLTLAFIWESEWKNNSTKIKNLLKNLIHENKVHKDLLKFTVEELHD